MSLPSHPPLARPPQVGDPVKVVVTGRIVELVQIDGVEHAVVHLDQHEDNAVVLPADQVWNQARPDDNGHSGS